MSQHSSLRATGFGVIHRNVLKRFERIKKLKADERWKEGNSVFGLPKVKSLKVKIKKIKEPKAEGATAGVSAGGAAGTVAPAAGASAPATKAPTAAKAATKPKARK